MFLNILSETYFGSTILQYILFFATIIISVLVSIIFYYYFIKKYGLKIASKTTIRFDDIFIEVLPKPMILGGFIIGLFLGYNLFIFNNEFLKNYFHELIVSLVIFDLAWLCLKLVDGFIDSFLVPLSKKTSTQLDSQLVPLLRRFFKITIMVTTAIIILSTIGVDVLPIIAGLGIGSLVLAFAAQKTVEDIFGGISIFAAKPFKIKDTIKVKGIEGDVESVGLRYTKIKDVDGRLVTIPNAQVAQEIVTNISSEETRKIQLTLGLKYGTSHKKIQEAIKILKEIANANPKIDNANTQAVFRNYSSSSLDILFIYHIKDKKNILEVISEINLEILKRFEKAGIEFAFPTQTIHIESIAKPK
jgi:MscS family membrane protein